MNPTWSLGFLFIFASLMLSANTQCNNCTTGTFCYTQDNSNSSYTLDTSPSTYCANCMSNCANCSSLSTCNNCDVGYFYYTQVNDPTPYVQSSASSQYCAACISDCNSCSSLTTCDECASGYSFNGTYCTSISNLDVGPVTTTGRTQFNMMWIVAIVGGIIGIGLIATVSYYCVVKRREKNFMIYGEPSVKEEMINGVGKNHFTIYEESSTRQ